MELNPNHPVTEGMRGQYHKIIAYLIWRYSRLSASGGRGGTELMITADDLEWFQRERPDGTNLIVEPKGRILRLRIVGDAEAERLAREAGGLPT